MKYEIEKEIISQRVKDGYINATSLCKASGKLFADFRRLGTTQRFLEELSRSMGIPIDVLITTKTEGLNELRGTWIHPHVAINFAR